MKQKLFGIWHALAGAGSRRNSHVHTPGEQPALPSMAENSYNPQGRLAKTTRSDGSYILYEYIIGAAVLKLYSASGVFLYSYHYEFNKDGLCNRITRSDQPQYEELTQYNDDKTIARKITSLPGITRILAYTPNNSTSENYIFN